MLDYIGLGIKIVLALVPASTAYWLLRIRIVKLEKDVEDTKEDLEKFESDVKKDLAELKADVKQTATATMRIATFLQVKDGGGLSV
ncbi:MAG: hypothetical protein AAF599_00165 [Bacteroidota bacterium]